LGSTSDDWPGLVRLHDAPQDKLVRIVKKLVERARLDAAKYAAHSLKARYLPVRRLQERRACLSSGRSHAIPDLQGKDRLLDQRYYMSGLQLPNVFEYLSKSVTDSHRAIARGARK